MTTHEVLQRDYDAAVARGDTGRRLFLAGRLASISMNPVDHLRYGFECITNLLLDRARCAFERAMQLAPEDYRPLVGLARCHLERLELDDAERLLRLSLQMEETEEAWQHLRAIDSLRNGK